jgi:hypothetical protein
MKRGAMTLYALALATEIAHLLLGRALSGLDFMQALTAARGGHVGAACAFGVFVCIRLAAILVVPAFLVADIGTRLAAYLVGRQNDGPARPPSGRVSATSSCPSPWPGGR